jgi:hypothetical protein
MLLLASNLCFGERYNQKGQEKPPPRKLKK